MQLFRPAARDVSVRPAGLLKSSTSRSTVGHHPCHRTETSAAVATGSYSPSRPIAAGDRRSTQSLDLAAQERRGRLERLRGL